MKQLHRNTRLYHKKRAALLERLGGRCVRCGLDDSEKLEFDHINGRDWNLEKCNCLQRINRYIKEADEGNIQLLCGDCNKAKRKQNDVGQFVPESCAIPKTEEIEFEPTDDIPF